MKFRQHLDSLSPSPKGDRVVAYFDLDRTLIAGYSVTAFAWERVKWGSLTPRGVLVQLGVFLGYGLGRADYHDLLQVTVTDLAGLREEDMVELGERAYRHRLQGTIYSEARALIDAHKACGHEVVMVTSATSYQAMPIARDVGVPHVLCTELEIEHGRITGRFSPCFGPGKRLAAQRFAQSRKALLADAYFYSDSTEDLPLLEAVGRPVPTNAKQALSKVATRRGWPQLAFAVGGEATRPQAA